MSVTKLASIEPYELCSIRPPTENYSLTFKLTRNCYWKKCTFCPANKLGARYSKRSIEEVKEDIKRVGIIDDVIADYDLKHYTDSGLKTTGVTGLVDRIIKARAQNGRIEVERPPSLHGDLDPLLSWFASWFNHNPTIEDSVNHVLAWRLAGGNNCFLGDADSMVLRPEFVGEVIKEIKKRFPTIQRFTVYGKTRSTARVRTIADLQAYRSAGLHRIHYGLESGSDRILRYVNKGSTKAEHIEAGQKTVEAGLACSVYIMPGLGGVRWSEEHATETAEVLTLISPDFIRLRSLQVFPQTPLSDAVKKGEFVEAKEESVVGEIRMLIEGIETETEILSDSATNLLNLNGRLPQDRAKLLETIDQYLELENREKLLFNFRSRMRSFIEQYGGLSSEILSQLSPFISGSRINFHTITDQEMIDITRLIRSRLMP